MEPDVTALKDWFVKVLSGLVLKPEAVEIEKVSDEQGILFRVRVASTDRGRVIGKKGTIASALRTIIRAAGYLVDARVSMLIEVPGSNFRPKDEEEDLNKRPEDR